MFMLTYRITRVSQNTILIFKNALFGPHFFKSFRHIPPSPIPPKKDEMHWNNFGTTPLDPRYGAGAIVIQPRNDFGLNRIWMTIKFVFLTWTSCVWLKLILKCQVWSKYVHWPWSVLYWVRQWKFRSESLSEYRNSPI